ncbi:hypothetical protein ACHAWF_009545 [Thalassiosira exigua]
MRIIPKNRKKASGRSGSGSKGGSTSRFAIVRRYAGRLPILGALSLSAKGSGAAAASAASAANFTRRNSLDSAKSSGSAGSSGRTSERRGSLDSQRDPIDDCSGYACGSNHQKYGGRWDIYGAAAAPPKAAFVPSLGEKRSKGAPVRPESRGSDAPSMNRAPSPIAFSAALKRSFGLTTTNMSAAPKRSDAAPPAPATFRGPPMRGFRDALSHSWIRQLSAEDPENLEKSLSKHRSGGGVRGGGHPGRPVYNGHYVRVRPTPLKNPSLVIHSPELAAELGFREGEAATEAFVKYFSGDVDGAFADVDVADAMDEDDAGMRSEKEVETWATPYALSIMGKRYTNNCPYGTGDGYGDGRAISVGEVLVPRSNDEEGSSVEVVSDLEELYPDGAARYELQLKGAGQTPFCRGADGRAVLRSSIREFLASEAMHHLGVSTTRALSLVVSDGNDGDTSARPWYSDGARTRDLPGMDDPRLAQYDEKRRRAIISQLAAQAKSDPDVLVEERCAITARVAPSFVRIGHLDLFARRVEMLRMKGGDEGAEDVKETSQYQELEDMMWHACYREFHGEAYAPFFPKKDAKGAALALMEGAMTKVAQMVANWVRVGFVQGNFNADNCLVGGRTMDYGPFGFLDVYHPLSAKWTGSGEHFGFMNQPQAGYANTAVLVESLLPIVDANGGDVDEVRDEMLEKAQKIFTDAVDEAMRAKMGLVGGPDEMGEEADELWGELEPLLRLARGDWTLFWRQLTYVAMSHSPKKMGKNDSAPDYDAMVKTLLGEGPTNPFYDPLTEENQATLRTWIEKWHKALCKCWDHTSKESKDAATPEETMFRSNPKYVLREWMLVEAYSKADPGKSPGNPFSVPGEYSGVHELFELIKDPYGEGTAEFHEKYYRRAPDESLRAGGTAFMS